MGCLVRKKKSDTRVNKWWQNVCFRMNCSLKTLFILSDALFVSNTFPKVTLKDSSIGDGSGRSDKAWLPYQQEDINPQTAKPLHSAALLHTPSETRQSFILPSQPLADLYHSLQRQRRRWAWEGKGEPCIRPEKNSAPRAPLITHIHRWQKVGQWKAWQLQRLQVPWSQKNSPSFLSMCQASAPMNGSVHTCLMSERPFSHDESTARLALGKEGN